MKKGVWALVVLIVFLAALSQVTRFPIRNVSGKKVMPTAALVDVRAIAAQPSPAPHRPWTTRVQLIPNEIISLDDISGDVFTSTVKFDQHGNIYCMTSLPEQRLSRLVKITPSQQQIQEVPVPDSANQELVAFDIGEDGIIHAALQSPTPNGIIVSFNTSGDIVSEIDTSSFLPYKIAADSEGRVWTLGQLLRRSPMGPSLQDVQLRIYAQRGELVSILAGGFQSRDAGLSEVILGESEATCTSFGESRVYKFAQSTYAQAKSYPFQILTDLEQVKDEPVLLQNRRLIKGISSIGNIKIWYGNIEDKNRQGVYPRSFIGITNLQDEPLTPEIQLPMEYRSLAGLDPQGNLYVYSKIDNKLVLQKVRLLIKQNG